MTWNNKAAKNAVSNARGVLAQKFRTISLAEFEAQRHSVEMIAVLREIATDPGIDPKTRIEAANHVLDRAFGKVATKVEVREVPADDRADVLEHEAASAVAEANELIEVEKWVASGQPPEAWPEAIRVKFGIVAGEASE